MKTYYGILKDGELLRRSYNAKSTIRFYDRHSDAKRQCRKLEGDGILTVRTTFAQGSYETDSYYTPIEELS
ncbi:hypothetical protein HOT82_gp110 [Gordonia phage Ronaldo]|uniref:Uncharacterized protein n=4 Tax=Ronaldovirus TaxID=2733205 RepID=A0A6B9L8N2_9CAUD|nr:hypothetical protein HOT81_gp108 [Gordonia phage Fryberger]YP_009807806.1 hypothetical protein HOT82_gp110 [Gordonia phage Ronaldo]QDH48449.1 hypothetical protein SEA_ZIKO_111 [Gordonia phage Ziko]QHB38226.1 hypothetical protein SEA_VOLT_112 [Gordonia phage Volt]QTF81896.1 hypothetical protein SEA_GUEY18_113 [Gordonia phage Guey18]AXN53524.1 hypothetical protein SEA_FRYBERGER_108 [Gordonia phage Fryberger]AXN53672.1 hypothetical protein SEA_RONALDO_110 [Gordonia phage Ronaldo]